MMQIKLIVFDLDGTLVDAYRAVASSVNFAMKEMGFPQVDADTIRRNVGWGDRHLLESFVGPKKIKKTLMIYRKHHRGSLKTGTKFLPGAKQILEYLKKQKYKLAIASNRPTLFTHIILKYLKIKQYFDYVLCGDKLKKAKPHPSILIQTLRQFSLKPSQALYVGDMTIDIVTGHRARVKTVAVVTGSCTKKELTNLKPFRIIDRISELVNVVNL